MMKSQYHILPYTYQKARELNVIIHKSENPKYKLDVYEKNGVFICSVGSSMYMDYPHYILIKGLKYANERKRLYDLRHAKDMMRVGTKGYYAKRLLW